MRRSTQRAIGMIGHGRSGREPAADGDGGAQVPGQEARDLCATAARGSCRRRAGLRAARPVDEAERELEAARVFEHAGEALGARVGLRGLLLGEPLLDEGSRPRRRWAGRRSWASSGGGGHAI